MRDAGDSLDALVTLTMADKGAGNPAMEASTSMHSEITSSGSTKA